ncbi:MAG: RNA polymerase sigma factor [Myxococcota bacterium]
MALDIGQLFERYHGVVFRRCLALLRNDADAEEAVQEVFVAAISGFGRFKLRSTPLTWLYAVATRHCLQRLRNQSTQALKLALFRDDEALELDLGGRVDVERFLAGLTLEQLELVTLAWRDGLTHEEIAAVTRQSRKTVGRKLAALAPSPRREQLRSAAQAPAEELTR